MKSFMQVVEEFVPKFQRATKTDVHYTGQINGKTYVVPHAFHGNHDVLHGTKVTPIHHSIVVSPTHVQHNNPTLTPEESARVHSHIKDIHGGQPDAKHDSFGKLEEADQTDLAKRHYAQYIHHSKMARILMAASNATQPHKDKIKHHVDQANEHGAWLAIHHSKMQESWLPMRGPRASKETPEVNDEHAKWEKAHAPASRKELKAARGMRTGAADRFMRRYGKTNEERQLALHLGMTKSDKKEPSKEEPAVKKAETHYKQTHKLVPGTPEHQAERDKYRHAALFASRKAATLAFAKKRGIIKERTIGTGSLKFNKIANSKPITYNSFGKIVKKEKTMSTPLKEHIWNVTDHAGNKHEVEAKDRGEAMKKTVSVGGIHPQGIPMSQWQKVRIERKNLEEKTLTPAETAKKEELVLKMKPKLQGFKERYGKDAKSVMYATATKNAKKLAEEPEQLNELSDAAKQFVHHREEHWKHAKLNRHAQDRTAAKFHSNEMQKHFHTMTPDEKYRAHTGSWVSSPSRRLGGGSAKEDKEYVHESFMGTYTRNENANRHSANIVHLAKHFGDAADQAQAKFYADELKKHGHNIHHEAQYKLHEKLWPKAVAAHHQGAVKEEVEQLDELKFPKTGYFDPDLRDVVSRVHDMGHHELKSLHKSYQKNAPQSTVQKQQHRSIKKALRKYGDPSGTRTDRVDKSKFVKKDLEEENKLVRPEDEFKRRGGVIKDKKDTRYLFGSPFKKALRKYGDPSGTHTDRVDKSKFVKKDLEEGKKPLTPVQQYLLDRKLRTAAEVDKWNKATAGKKQSVIPAHASHRNDTEANNLNSTGK